MVVEACDDAMIFIGAMKTIVTVLLMIVLRLVKRLRLMLIKTNRKSMKCIACLCILFHSGNRNLCLCTF